MSNIKTDLMIEEMINFNIKSRKIIVKKDINILCHLGKYEKRESTVIRW